MASASISETINAPLEAVFRVITDYESYPEFLKETKGVTIKSTKGKVKLVEFELDLIKKFHYVLRIEEVPNEKVSWTLESGDLFKKNVGGWDLEDLDGDTQATYHIDLEFKLLVPKIITKTLVGANLPAMMKGFKERAEAKSAVTDL
ncbi:MAG TPA: SRPBCC family protein [Bdellovibrionota bacterium]|nr:SRPBCC family protein [Bdellovibrionota bacterium]